MKNNKNQTQSQVCFRLHKHNKLFYSILNPNSITLQTMEENNSPILKELYETPQWTSPIYIDGCYSKFFFQLSFATSQIRKYKQLINIIIYSIYLKYFVQYYIISR